MLFSELWAQVWTPAVSMRVWRCAGPLICDKLDIVESQFKAKKKHIARLDRQKPGSTNTNPLARWSSRAPGWNHSGLHGIRVLSESFPISLLVSDCAHENLGHHSGREKNQWGRGRRSSGLFLPPRPAFLKTAPLVRDLGLESTICRGRGEARGWRGEVGGVSGLCHSAHLKTTV